MKPTLKNAWKRELTLAAEVERQGDLERAFRHLERAHVLSQAYAWPHLVVHVRMLAFGVRRRDAREVLGQLARIALAAPGSWLGRAPLGNTGGSNVGIFQPMAIPDDLRALLEA